MISVNYRDLELLRNFVTMFEVFENPDKYQKIASDTKAILATYETATAKYETLQAVQKALKEAEAQLAATEQADKDAAVRREKAQAMADAKNATVQASLDKLVSEAKRKNSDASELLAHAEESVERVKLMEKQLQDKVNQFEQRVKEVEQREAALAEKQAALKALVS